uniref:Uncharacterized protein n=1 Tax=Branchiostoma floridae TaxID=7739 RepID=C3Y779_BRAFL|eukprot:XP_002607697.1 hypothetical protein BRAFLDRAFT_82857 [Branchiostoma floridae]
MDERDQVMRVAGDGEGTPAGVQPLSRSPNTDYNSNSYTEFSTRPYSNNHVYVPMTEGNKSNVAGDGGRTPADVHPLSRSPNTDYNLNSYTEFPTRPYSHYANHGLGAYVSTTEGGKSNVAGEREGTPADVQSWRRPPHTDYNSHRPPFAEYTNGLSYNHHPTPGQPGDVVINDKANLIPPPIYNPRFFDYAGSTMMKLPGLFRYFSTEKLLQTAGKGREGRNYFCMLVWCPALCFADGITAIKKAILGSMANCRNKSKTRYATS